MLKGCKITSNRRLDLDVLLEYVGGVVFSLQLGKSLVVWTVYLLWTRAHSWKS